MINIYRAMKKQQCHGEEGIVESCRMDSQSPPGNLHDNYRLPSTKVDPREPATNDPLL